MGGSRRENRPQLVATARRGEEPRDGLSRIVGFLDVGTDQLAVTVNVKSPGVRSRQAARVTAELLLFSAVMNWMV